jgi:hypothetical protein
MVDIAAAAVVVVAVAVAVAGISQRTNIKEYSRESEHYPNHHDYYLHTGIPPKPVGAPMPPNDVAPPNPAPGGGAPTPAMAEYIPGT